MISAIRRLSLSQWILVALVAGILMGWFISHSFDNGSLSGEAKANWLLTFKMMSGAFLHLIKCIIVPLIFSTLVVGIAGHSDDMKAVGRMALKAIIYFEIATTAALFVGLGAVNLIQPGAGVVMSKASAEVEKMAATKVTVEGVVEHLTPQSFFDAAARNDVLQVVVYALIFGISLAQVKGKPKETMLAFFEGMTQVMFKFTGIVMLFAPFGVGAAIAGTVGQNGLGILMTLGKLVLTLYGALAVFVLIVLIPAMLIARIPVRRFFRTIREPALLAFSTANSEAALPDAMRLMQKFGVPQRIVSFVLPTGYSFNLDGSTLHLAVASVFVAQAAGIHLDFKTQIMMMLTLMMTSKGVAAVPRATLVILSGTLATFGLPLEGVALILGVDAFLDMARTSVNLVGNCLASAVVARWEGELNIPEREAAEDDSKLPDLS
ncbi:MAG: gltP [Verrucomicrobiaceae bacterium]|nr:gltP [Verrucomicrobiaceae bacterium]